MKNILPFITIAGVVVYALLGWVGQQELAKTILTAIIILTTIPLVVDIIQTLREKRFGVDILALTSITGSLLLGETLAGAIIVLMLSGGEFLENYAMKRSRRELNSLLNNAPKIAHRLIKETIEDISVDLVAVGDLLLVKSGEVVPVDAVVSAGSSSVNEANITGESVPVTKTVGDHVYSGSVVLDQTLRLTAAKSSSQSKYQQIVELVRKAEQERAPFVRMADRYSLVFTLIAFTIAGAAFLITQDPVRALTVFVVATPCPLILATPIAFSSGISIGARKGIIFKNGAVLEALATARVVALDKTGTLTLGEPALTEILLLDSSLDKKDLIMEVASLEQFSQHVLGKALLKAAKEQQVTLQIPQNFKEEFGMGISGSINGTELLVGKPSFLEERGVEITADIKQKYGDFAGEGRILVMAARNGKPAGIFEMEDPPRVDAGKTIALLKQAGINRILMMTGDKHEVAHKIATQFGIDEVRANCLPEDKLNLVKEIKAEGHSLIMVGDGVNDAPALVAANVGIAIGYLGTSASTESAQVIITVPQLDRIHFALELSRKVLSIAKQGIFLGIGLSILLMFMGASGLFVPFVGALLQELVDVAVIFNALRVRI